MSNMTWHGHAAHFIGAAQCRFHLATSVGDVVVSTVGDWYPKSSPTAPEMIGWQRYFETMVFRIGAERHLCGCPVIIDPDALETRGYNTALEAEAGHLAMVTRYAGATSSLTTS